MWYIHTMEFSLKKKWNSDTCYNLGESGRHYAKWNQPVAKKDKHYAILPTWGT